MNSSQPQLVKDGVAFTVSVEFVKHHCIVSRDALTTLASGSGQADLMRTYLAYEANINGIARRLIAAGVPGTPLELGPQNFKSSQI
ncbi:uncharacterized protein DUF1488 [Paucimonas lemoignei]|uniref:Uncharacterized protein DUF1488 n=1 Tax=Paucimonas lemoignei TaxID=29443 RepID=A0A4R3HTD2_PAULE|nr:DUF1488 family protein [Paucimonas lemoignei]TCS36302.1 uncharacterized protein DUF1488 [Paucimonas lemoignei]